MNVREAFAAIVRNCVEHLAGNRSGLVAGHDPEYVHQMRIAVRRLRSVCKLFKPALPKIWLGRLHSELRWLDDQLGPTRDFDVLIGETLTAALDDGIAEAAALRARLLRLHAQRYKAVRAAVDSPRYRHLLHALHALSDARQWPMEQRSAQLETPIQKLTSHRLRKLHRRLTQSGRHLTKLDEAARHRVRIAAKHMRYATEFFMGLYGEGKTKRYVKALAAVQKDLGRLNDYVTAQRLLTNGALADWLTRRTETGLQGAGKSWRHLRSRKKFWTT